MSGLCCTTLPRITNTEGLNRKLRTPKKKKIYRKQRIVEDDLRIVVFILSPYSRHFLTLLHSVFYTYVCVCVFVYSVFDQFARSSNASFLDLGSNPFEFRWEH